MANPPLVVPGIVRFTVMGKIANRQWANVFDVDFGSAAPVGGGVMKGLAEKLMDVYAGAVSQNLVAQWQIEACRWIDLNSALGETGYINDTPTGTFPRPGAKVQEPLPANVSMIIRKGTQGARNHRNGRTYICGIPEADTTGNQMTSAALALWATVAGQVDGVLTGSTSGIGHIFSVAGRDKDMNVHKSVVATYAPDGLLATQRRRLRA